VHGLDDIDAPAAQDPYDTSARTRPRHRARTRLLWMVWVCGTRQHYAWFADVVARCARRARAYPKVYPQLRAHVYVTRDDALDDAQCEALSDYGETGNPKKATSNKARAKARIAPAHIVVHKGRPDMFLAFEKIERDMLRVHKSEAARRGEAPSDAPLAAVIACGPDALVNATWDESVLRSLNGKNNCRFALHHELFNF